MKKVLLISFFVALFLFVSPVFAATGDVVGDIYSTDIETCINGIWVDSYNIGGQTVVIVEDITSQCVYSDELRILVINELNPMFLKAGSNKYSQTSGIPVGKIYETDIKTYFRGKELTSYSLNGKMAVVVEELGWDNTLSDIGGKFIWNGEERTLALESLFCYPYAIRDMLETNCYSVILDNVDGALKARTVASPIGYKGHIICEATIPDNSIVPVFYNDEIIGYKCRFTEMRFSKNENDAYYLEEYQKNVDHFYPYAIANMIQDSKNYLATDIGMGTDSGQPSEYDAKLARNGQYEYKIISDNGEISVNGFVAPEYYYANMLPMAEIFDFLNITYSFTDNILTIDTSDAKPFSFELTENKADVFREEPIKYLLVDKTVVDGVDSQITYQYISGHFDNTHQGKADAKPYVCNGKVYVNDSFVKSLCEK